MHNIALPLIAVLLVGCSSQPATKSTAVPPAVAATPVPAAPNVAAGSAAEQAKAPPGYKAVKRDGQMFYCKETSQVGTRFTKTECMTPDEYAEYERSGAEVRQELQRRSNMCNSPTGNCGG